MPASTRQKTRYSRGKGRARIRHLSTVETGARTAMSSALCLVMWWVIAVLIGFGRFCRQLRPGSLAACDSGVGLLCGQGLPALSATPGSWWTGELAGPGGGLARVLPGEHGQLLAAARAAR